MQIDLTAEESAALLKLIKASWNDLKQTPEADIYLSLTAKINETVLK